MRNRVVTLCAVLGLLGAGAFPASAQVTLELHGVLGYNQVDVDAWAGTTAVDWNQFTSGGYAQLFFVGASVVSFGVEAGYHYLLFYQIRLTGRVRDRNVDANRVMGVARFSLGGGSVFAEAAAGAYLFDFGSDLAVAGALGTRIRVGPKVSIPLKVRADAILDSDATMIPVTVSAGLSIKLGT